MDGMMAKDKLALDINLPLPAEQSQIEALTVGLYQLHARASARWPQGYQQAMQYTDGIYSVEMSAKD